MYNFCSLTLSGRPCSHGFLGALKRARRHISVQPRLGYLHIGCSCSVFPRSWLYYCTSCSSNDRLFIQHHSSATPVRMSWAHTCEKSRALKYKRGGDSTQSGLRVSMAERLPLLRPSSRIGRLTFRLTVRYRITRAGAAVARVISMRT